MAKKMKVPTPRKARQALNRHIEKAKRNLAHSTPLSNPRESWTSKKHVGGVPVCILECKQHKVHHYYRYWW